VTLTAAARTIFAACLAVLVCLLVGALAPALADAQACSTANPASDFSGQTDFSSDTGIQNAFTAARAAEGCNVALVLPAGYDAMTPAQQTLWLFNNEREVRGVTDLAYDGTLMSQIALNHSQEMVQYGYFAHISPINQLGVGTPFVNLPRDVVNPIFANDFFGENIAAGYGTVAESVFGYMYQDTSSGWGHRGAILQGAFNWLGVGVIQNAPGNWGAFYTDDFATIPAGYVPPAQADTNPPVMGAISYGNGTATVTGVADSPANVNDTGANPLTAGVTGVVFYTNNIVDSSPNMDGTGFNTVSATQSSPGTWTAPVTVNPGDVLHAVAVDGSGNFTDMVMAAPAMPLNAGTNTVAIPAAGAAPTPPGATAMAREAAAPGDVPAATPSAAALVDSVNQQIGRNAVDSVRVYRAGQWHTYRPGKTASFPLYANQGVVLRLRAQGTWRPPAGQELSSIPVGIHVHRGWNFVAVPYPVTGMTCHAVRLELAKLGDRLEQITVGPSPTDGVIMRPEHGQWGNDLTKHIPNGKGFWIELDRAADWVPSPTQFATEAARAK
jgi:uncharacterized protein YkwD